MKTREDWLYEQLDDDDLEERLRIKYEMELDIIAERRTALIESRKNAELEEKTRLAELRARILANEDDFINSFGEQQFGQDYELVQEGVHFVVYSKVCKDDQERRRVHLTIEAARADLRYLFYNRLYDRYVRNGGELINLMELIDE